MARVTSLINLARQIFFRQGLVRTPHQRMIFSDVVKTLKLARVNVLHMHRFVILQIMFSQNTVRFYLTLNLMCLT